MRTGNSYQPDSLRVTRQEFLKQNKNQCSDILSLAHAKPPVDTWTTLSVAGLCGITTAVLAPVCGFGVIAISSVEAIPARHTA